MRKVVWNKPYPPIFVHSTNVSLYEPLDADFEFLNKVCIVRKNADIRYDRMWNMFPGLYCDNDSYYEEYKTFYEKEFESGNYPRGNLNSGIAVVGLAPGYVDRVFKEPMWLLGPSSRLLRDSLTKSAYFTNVKWKHFQNNFYDDSYDFSSDVERLERELSVVSPKVVIFLGKYQVYNEVFVGSNVERHNVYHPSYLLRKPNSMTKQKWFEDIAKHIKSNCVELEDLIDVSQFKIENSIFRDDEYVKLRDAAF